jgi:triphosphoribosyl-dephospho-CoA synthase
MQKKEILWRISTSAVAASVLETSFPKPGNVHPLRNYSDLRYEHMLVAGAGIGKGAYESAEKGYEKDYSGLGKIILQTTKYCNTLHSGRNPNFGIILMLTPLCMSAGRVLSKGEFGKETLRKELKKVLDSCTPTDTTHIIQAIKESEAITTVEGKKYEGKYDIFNPKINDLILKEKVTPLKLFEFSQNFDCLAQEWVSSYEIVFSHLDFFESEHETNTAVVNTFLKVLSEYPDTLIARKAGLEKAQEVSVKAGKILELGGMRTDKGKEKVLELDRFLAEKENELNPGTTADLIASILFIELLSGWMPF